jgi:amidase
MDAAAIVLMNGQQLAAAIQSRSVSCVEVMEAYLDHIERANASVNAIVLIRDRGELLGEARARDDDLARGEVRGWMHGFPQAIKDLASVKGLPTTQGSPIYKDAVAAADSIFVERMRAAGSIFVGKTTTPEFGLGSHTFSPVFGHTRNPYDLSRTPGGSSGGAGAALAMRMLPVADGSDHGGSLRNPAAFNNVMALRTSYGRVPIKSDEVFLPAMGVAGPMARTATDLAALLAVQSGYDPRVPLSIREDPARFTRNLERDFRGVRVGWLGDFDGYLPTEPGILDVCADGLKALERVGCVVEPAKPEFSPEAVWNAWRTLRGWQAGSSLVELYNDPHKRALLKPEAQWEVEQGLKVTAFDVTKASTVRTAWYHAVRRLFEAYDFLVLPSTQVFPFPVEWRWPKEIAGRTMDTYHRWMEVVIPVTMSGCPALALPVGFNAAGLPTGMQVVAPNHGEHALLQLARAYEQEAPWLARRPPLLDVMLGQGAR